MKKTIFILFIAISLNAKTQNIFPVKLDDCDTKTFCLDCGDVKAGYDGEEFLKLQRGLNKTLYLKGVTGMIMFQVLVDSNGNACILSHTDKSNSPITQEVIKQLHNFKKWQPASTNGKKEQKSSINIVFTINDNKISGQIERVDVAAFIKSFDRPMDPRITNINYKYKNDNLKNYKITVWNTKNSNLPNNMNDNIAIEKNGLIWLSVDSGLVTFDGNEFKNAEDGIKGKYFGCYALAIDNNNMKWAYGEENIYSFDNTKWTKYDSSDIGINRASKIINNPNTGEVFFCWYRGLTIYKNGKWSTSDSNKIKDLPSNDILFAKRDSKKRLWIGTFKGTVMIDENNQVTSFEKTETILKGKGITSMDEDENGNLYFTLYDFEKKGIRTENSKGGIAIRYADNSFKQLTPANSGMPSNHANDILYDKVEKVLWISTDAGLVRYDLKEGWENYHNQNSAIPTSYIKTMTFDNKGTLYLGTRQGLVKIERK